MVKRPIEINAFEFAVLAGLRAAQLHRGCTPRVERSEKVAVTAQHEVAQRKVLPLPMNVDPADSVALVVPPSPPPALAAAVIESEG